jgi:transcriptional regulator with XRE-family HTH domain
MSARNDPKRRLAFDAVRFECDLHAIARQRGLSMHKLSFEVGVHSATLSHMRRGVTPDGPNLAALCKWSGLNAADYSIDREHEEMAG